MDVSKVKYAIASFVFILIGLATFFISREYKNSLKPFAKKELYSYINIKNHTDKIFMDTILDRASKILDVKGCKLVLHYMPNVVSESNQGLKAYVLPSGEKEYLIFVNKNLSRYESIDILTHELVHVKDFVSGKLKYITHPIAGISYNGMFFPKDRMPSYYFRPWEEEAFRKTNEVLYEVKDILY